MSKGFVTGAKAIIIRQAEPEFKKNVGKSVTLVKVAQPGDRLDTGSNTALVVTGKLDPKKGVAWIIEGNNLGRDSWSKENQSFIATWQSNLMLIDDFDGDEKEDESDKEKERGLYA